MRLSIEKRMDEIVGQMNQLSLQMELEFPEYEILSDWRFLKYCQKRCHEEFFDALTIEGKGWEVIPETFVPEARRHFMNFISGNYVVMTNMFAELKSLRRSQEIEEIVRSWKLKPTCKLVQRLRNRVQHGKLLRESVFLSQSSEGQKRNILVANHATWSAIQKEASASELRYLVPWLNDIDNFIPELVDRYWDECQRMFDSVENIFTAAYGAELSRRSEHEERRTALQAELLPILDQLKLGTE